MSSSQRIEDLGAVNLNGSTNALSSKLKTCGFAIAIILGLGGIGVGITGLVGCLHVGGISNLAQVNAIIMMATGGGGGIVFLIIGIVGILKNRRKDNAHLPNESNAAPSTTDHPAPITNEEKSRSKDTKGKLVYGAEAYTIWKMEVVETIPDAPEVDWNAHDPYFKQPYRENYVQLYFAEKVKFNGKVRVFDLKTLQKACKGSFSCFNPDIATQFNQSICPGWRLVSNKTIPNSGRKDFETQKNMAEKHPGFRMLHVIEAIFLNMAVFKLTNEQLYGQKPWTYARCFNQVHGRYAGLVGGFGPRGLLVSHLYDSNDENFGVAVIREC